MKTEKSRKGVVMQYLVQMHLSGSSRPMNQEEGISLIEEFILPTLERCKKLQEEKRILAGGPASGAIALALIVNAESAQELDDLITGLPVWPRMETQVTPLTTFEARRRALLPRLEQFKAQARASGTSAPRGDP
jgi:muconolactone delta-isomerase